MSHVENWTAEAAQHGHDNITNHLEAQAFQLVTLCPGRLYDHREREAHEGAIVRVSSVRISRFDHVGVASSHVYLSVWDVQAVPAHIRWPQVLVKNIMHTKSPSSVGVPVDISLACVCNENLFRVRVHLFVGDMIVSTGQISEREVALLAASQ